MYQYKPTKKTEIPREALLKGILAILIACTILLGAIYISETVYPLKKLVSDKVAVIYVQGLLITEKLPDDFYGYATTESICGALHDASEDSRIKAIVLRVNSPGGTASASQEILTEVKKAQSKGIPVVVSMGDLAASGAYYISVSSDRIVADADTMTGSIGVSWLFENKEEYYEEEGINYTIIKSGKMKDMGADWRALTPEEREYAQHVVDTVFERFLGEVSIGRNISLSDARNLSDGRIYTGSDAREYGLVDDLGNLYDAIDIAAGLAGARTPEVVYMNEPKEIYEILTGDEDEDTEEMAPIFWDYNPYGQVLMMAGI